MTISIMSEDKPPSASKKTLRERLSNFFQGEPQNKKELEDVIHEAEMRDVINEETKEMMQGVLEVTTLKVRDIMIPRSQITAIQKNQTTKDILKTVIESAHSRFPVIHDDKDHIEGILLAKDLLKYGFKQDTQPFSLDLIIRPAVVVPESKRVDALLKEFRSKRYHMAIVVDEYGGVSGLVTIEDILEEIVGEIEDEYDHELHEQHAIKEIEPNHFLIDALTPIEDFNEHFQTTFKDDEFDTIGGLIAHSFGHLPNKDEQITLKNFEFTIKNSDTRRIIELHVKRTSTNND